jgi:hypothetical protein
MAKSTTLSLYPGKDPLHIMEEVVLVPGPVWTGAENLTPTGIRSQDRPARSESLYRLRYPGPHKCRYIERHTERSTGIHRYIAIPEC